MSTKEVEKTADESADEETDWLYGDDNFEEEETTEKEVFSALIGDVDGVNGVCYQDSDSDSDDDVCVTIGDIKTGASQGSSFGSGSINLSLKSSASGSKSRGLDAEGAVLQVDVESFEEKPWRKPGADLSDYFNYGFNEDSWKVYCDKQRRLRMSLEILSLGSSNKITVHQSSHDLSEYSSRKSSGLINVIGGHSGTISRVEGRRRHGADENNIQVVSEKSSDTELSSPKLLPFFPPNIPPPPFPPPSISTTPPLIPPPPPGFPLPPGALPPMIPTLDSSGRLAGGYDRRSAPPFPFPTGVYSPAMRVASWPSVIDSSKSWENYSRHNKERMREKTRERGHKKERERERERERYKETDREHSPTSQDHRSEEERTSRHRDHSHYGSERYRESSGREGPRDRHRERRHREQNEHRSSRSSSSRRRHDSDDAESHRRHRHKRSRHSRGNLEPSEECSADQENQSEATE